MRRGVDVPRYARLVSFDEIADAKNDFNLNLPRYIDATEPEDVHDIDAHLNGGVPERDLDALASYWAVLPGVRAALFEPAGRPGYARLRLPIGEVRAAILAHPEFDGFNRRVTALFEAWRAENTPRLTGFDQGEQPKQLIEAVSEALLAAFRAAPLLDAYDVYQHLMDYWAETMQDDAYLIAADGWVAKTERILDTDRQGRTRDRGWSCELVPKPYVVARYFAAEQAALDALHAELEAVGASLAELIEEHGGEDGVLSGVSTKTEAQAAFAEALVALWNHEDRAGCVRYTALIEEAEADAAELRALSDHGHVSALKNNRGRLTLKAVRERRDATPDAAERATLDRYLEADRRQKASAREAAALLAKAEARYRRRLDADPLPDELVELHAAARYLDLLDEQTALRSRIREADAALDLLAYEKYPTLTRAEIQTLVVDDKWMAHLSAALRGELERVSQRLTGRIRELAERYATPLPQLTDEVAALAARVEEHLARMGAAWR